MSEKAKEPVIRFKGFSEEWEERKLGDLMEVTSVKRIHQSDWTDSGVRFLRARDIVAESKNEEISEPLFISWEKYDEYSAISGKVKIGDLLVTGVGTIGVPMLINSDESLYFKDGNIIWFKNENAIDGRFFYYSFNGCNIQKFIKESAGIGTVGTYTIESGKKTPINLPQQKEEQQKIGSYFRQLDRLITLYQRKYNKLTSVKKSMLQKMFPASGQTKPALRFAGFTDKWEVRKLGEVAKEIKRTDETSNAPVMMITAENGFINQSERYSTNNAGESLKKYILLEKGELAYNHGASKLRPYGSCFSLTTEEKARIPFVYHCFSSDSENAEFLSIALNGKAVESQLRRIVSSGARMDGLLNISFQEYTSIPILLPERAEQDKIANYFRQLDHLIALHQQELQKLQNLKKACLKKMFV